MTIEEQEKKEQEKTSVEMTIGEIFSIICPTCKEKLLDTVTNKIATSSIRKELEKQWSKK